MEKIIYLWNWSFGKWDIEFFEEKFGSNYIWITDYNLNGYFWQGILVLLNFDTKKWGLIRIEHCSCNWPLSNYSSWKFTYKEIKELIEKEEWITRKNIKKILQFIKKHNL